MKILFALLFALLPFTVSTWPGAGQADAGPQRAGWVDLNGNGRKDTYEDASAPAEARVEDLLSRMTLEEKIDLLGGVDDFYVRGVERLGVPRLKMADGPIGVRNFGPATALAEILFGVVNPSGRLPVTFERRWEDNPAHDSYYPEAGTNRIRYKEGIFVGYRGYQKSGARPLFPFGYGLSYTTFRYSGLRVRRASGGPPSPAQYEVSFDVKNTGSRQGAETAQVYLGDAHSKVPRPPKELRGFVKVSLRPGETRRLKVMLGGRALCYYDAGSRLWRAEPGTFDVMVGRSSEQVELKGSLTLEAAVTLKD